MTYQSTDSVTIISLFLSWIGNLMASSRGSHLDLYLHVSIEVQLFEFFCGHINHRI